MAWHDADPARQVVNGEYDRAMDEIVAAVAATMERAAPQRLG